jgi:preprotein translocase subunit SecE
MTVMAKTSPVKFFEEVRQEVSRVTWPTRKETMTTTAMVLLMVFVAAGFFFLVDQVCAAGVRLVFGLGS